MPWAEGRYPDNIDACDGSVVDGMIVCACHVYAPRAARPMIAGAPAWSSASGRSPSTEKITTRGVAGEGDGEGTRAAGVGWVAECPQPERRRDTNTASGRRRARHTPARADCSREPKTPPGQCGRECPRITWGHRDPEM